MFLGAEIRPHSQWNLGDLDVVFLAVINACYLLCSYHLCNMKQMRIGLVMLAKT